MQDLVAMLESARAASYILAELSEAKKQKVLESMAESLDSSMATILSANEKDMANAKDLSITMQKRLALNEAKIRAMAQSLRQIATLPCNVGNVIKSWQTRAGLHIEQVAIPLGVIGIIYESRPNVTSDVGALCFKSGNVSVLKGGKEALDSNLAIFSALQSALSAHNLPSACINMIDSTSREATLAFIKQDSYIDLLIPRGGEGLISFVKENATIPIIKHDKGVCHTYIHQSANLDMALNIALNAKLSYPAACNACECVIIDKALCLDSSAPCFLATLVEAFHAESTQVMFETSALLERFGNKNDGLADYSKEWGENIINIKIVDGFEAALAHIAKYGSKHSECIVALDSSIKEAFLKRVDAACVYANASTRFSDGFEFGFGAEIGISTSKLHARGPMGLSSLLSYKYCIRGNGEVR